MVAPVILFTPFRIWTLDFTPLNLSRFFHFPANIVRVSSVYIVTAMAFIVANQGYKDEPTSRVLRIMMLSRLMSDYKQRDMRRFAISANLLAAQPVRTRIQQHFAGYPGNTGLRSEESSYPLRS
jgi:hypothetical protein